MEKSIKSSKKYISVSNFFLFNCAINSLSFLANKAGTLFFIAKGKKIHTSAVKLWIIAGVFELYTAIIYIITIDIIFYLFTQSIGYPEYDFWRVYNFHFGMLTPFIGAALYIIGAIIGVLNKRELNKINSKSFEA